MFTCNPSNLGEFQELDHRKYFSFRGTSDAWALANGLPHEIDVLDGIRFANILKTVAYVAVDEDGDGKPSIERWAIRRSLFSAHHSA